MKKSQFLAELPIKTGLRPTQESWWDAIARYLEDTGLVTWDPEEEPLPERLSHHTEFDHHFLAPERGIWKNDKQRAAGYAAAARRYNAWPELRAIADQCTYGITSAPLQRLRAILDGRNPEDSHGI